MSAGNLLHRGTIATLAFIWGGVISEMPWIFFQIWEISFCREDSAKEHHGLLFYGTFLAVEDESFFLGHIEQVYDVCVVVPVILSEDEHIITDGQYTGALGHNVIHPHLEDIL